MSTALIRQDGATVAWSAEALEAREVALAAAGIIAKVTNADEQGEAVEAQKALRLCLKMAEDARETAKRPVLEYGRKIDAAAKEFQAELRAEEMRIARAIGDFQAVEAAKARAAEALRIAELNAIEKARQEQISQAKTVEQVDQINEQASREAANLPVYQPVREAGQVVKEEWEVTVMDIWALARTYPMCVKVEARMSEIKDLLDQGIKLPGVTAKRVHKSTVRAKPVTTLELNAQH